MKTIFSNVTLKIQQILLLSILVLISAVGEMMLPSLLARMFNNGVSDSSRRTILTLAVVMAGITVLACTINFYRSGWLPVFPQTLLPDCAAGSLAKYKAFPPKNWIPSVPPAWSREAPRISPMFRTFSPCSCGSESLLP